MNDMKNPCEGCDLLIHWIDEENDREDYDCRFGGSCNMFEAYMRGREIRRARIAASKGA